MVKELKILECIFKASPTDVLWANGGMDERQLGMSYEDLEKATLNPKDKNYKNICKLEKEIFIK